MLGLEKITRKLFGDSASRTMRQYSSVVERVNVLEPEMKEHSDAELQTYTQKFRQRLQAGESLDDIMFEAFAVVREVSRRAIGLRHYDVQIIGGAVLYEGKIAEMKTGEGKTLVATLPLYLNALASKGVHLVTPNDYLSKVGVQLMGPIYHFLGMKAAVIQNKGAAEGEASFVYDPDYRSADERYEYLRPITRREAYQADITYGTNNEFGFDYLRDNLVKSRLRKTQRELHYAIVDEVDNILIDEARTPLIISGLAAEPSPLYGQFAILVRNLKPSSEESMELEDPDGDYVYDLKDKTVYLTDQGNEKMEKAARREGLISGDELYSEENAHVIPYLDNALRARVMYHRDQEYVVTQSGQVVIVDEFTGRMMPGRRFSEGLHQAIEAKEGVEIRRENVTVATITFQNYFRKYDKLAGMTGTAETEKTEFERIYDLEVRVIPTNEPIRRLDKEDVIYITEKAKFKAIVDDIKNRQTAGQPVLVGTASIDTSERLAGYLERTGITHEILNAKQHFREATIIEMAGAPGSVTIATNMAGRGVDILLGGNPEGLARRRLRQKGFDVTEATPRQWQQELEDARKTCQRDKQKVITAGGLYVLGTERHEARRIDNQLRGRSGRQGDPGESRFYLSLEDDLMKRFGGERIRNIIQRFDLPEDLPIEQKMISKSIEQAQVRVEGHNFDIRKRVLEYDDVVNKQREAIYEQRDEILHAKPGELRPRLERMIVAEIQELCEAHLNGEDERGEEALENLWKDAFQVFPVPDSVDYHQWKTKSVEDVVNQLIKAALRAYDRIEEETGSPEDMLELERLVILDVLDQLWVRHLTDLSILREGIGLQGVRGRNPLVEYQIQGFQMYENLQNEFAKLVVRNIFRARLQRRQPVVENLRAERQDLSTNSGKEPARPEPVRVNKKPGRNEPCYCGSGKKYKDCHYRIDRQQLQPAPSRPARSARKGRRR